MANYANQKTVKITNVTAIYNDNSSDLFLHSIKWKYIQAARKILSDCGFTVWLYFLKWSGTENQLKDFSPAQVKEEFGISENGARNGFKELELKGYLKKEPTRKNLYIFTPISTTEVAI